MNIYEKVESMTEREALKELLKVVIGEYPTDDDRYVLAWTIAMKYGIPMQELD
jgi:hypothetical protein